MKKKLMALCLAICMAFSVMLFGCFDTENNPDASTDLSNTEQTGGNTQTDNNTGTTDKTQTGSDETEKKDPVTMFDGNYAAVSTDKTVGLLEEIKTAFEQKNFAFKKSILNKETIKEEDEFGRSARKDTVTKFGCVNDGACDFQEIADYKDKDGNVLAKMDIYRPQGGMLYMAWGEDRYYGEAEPFTRDYCIESICEQYASGFGDLFADCQKTADAGVFVSTDATDNGKIKITVPDNIEAKKIVFAETDDELSFEDFELSAFEICVVFNSDSKMMGLKFDFDVVGAFFGLAGAQVNMYICCVDDEITFPSFDGYQLDPSNIMGDMTHRFNFFGGWGYDDVD